MNHEEYRILLSAYFDGEVSPEEKTLIEDHLIGCPECQKEFAEYKKISMSLKRCPRERLSPDVELNIEARLAKSKERTMEKEIQWGPLVGVLIVMILSVSVFHQYAKRSLQARVRDASSYMSQQTIAMGTTNQYEPYYLSSNYAVDRVAHETVELSSPKQRGPGVGSLEGRLKSATDDIGDQFSSGNTSYHKVERIAANTAIGGSVVTGAKKDYRQNLATAQSSSDYYGSPNAVQERKEADKLALMNYTVESEPRSLVAPSTIVTSGRLEGYQMPMKQVRDEEDVRYYGGYDSPYYPVPPQGTESYESSQENNFADPTTTPLSTFSIDVDTASYSNVRRFLAQGQIPPAEAVRVEELINYFSYDYPEPMWGQPFSITTEIAACPWNPSHQLALVGLQGKRLASFTMPASNLVFLIDVSGSMNQPNKLPLLQDAFRMMVQELEAKDKISIVVYAGSAGVVLEATSGNFKGRIVEAINSLSAGGSTAGGEGIRLAYQIARKNLINRGNNRVILATDGDFNVGVSSDDELVRMIESYRNEGIFLTVLGFGEGNLKDSKMEKLADHGNGNYFYIDSLSEARKVLVHELGSTIFTIAKDVKIQVEFNPATVRQYRLIGYENRSLRKEEFNDDSKDAGELGAGHTVTALYEIVPTYLFPREYGVDPLIYQREKRNPMIMRGNSSDLMTVKLRYKEPKGTTSKFIKKSVTSRDPNDRIVSENLRWASAVAEFGLLLKNSPYRGQASFDHVLSQIQSVKPDTFGYRSEFIGLVERARALSPYQYPVPVPTEDPLTYQNEPSYQPHGKSQK